MAAISTPPPVGRAAAARASTETTGPPGAECRPGRNPARPSSENRIPQWILASGRETSGCIHLRLPRDVPGLYRPHAPTVNPRPRRMARHRTCDVMTGPFDQRKRLSAAVPGALSPFRTRPAADDASASARHGRCSIPRAPCAGAPMDFLAKLAGKRDVPPRSTGHPVRGSSRTSAASGSASRPWSASRETTPTPCRVIARLEERAAALTQMLDEVGTRAEQVRQSTAGVDAIEARIAALEGNVREPRSGRAKTCSARGLGQRSRRSRNWSRARKGLWSGWTASSTTSPSARCCRSMRAPISRR